MRPTFRWWICAASIAAALAALAVLPAAPVQACVGDCNGDRRVTIDELLRAVPISLGEAAMDTCPAIDNNLDETATVNELVRGVAKALNGCGGGPAGQVLFSLQGNQLDEYDLASGARTVTVPETHAHVNGQACLLPGGSGEFVVGEDTGQPAVRPGWGVFSPDGTFLRKFPLPPRGDETGVGDPIGCAVDAEGRLFGTAIGSEGGADGQLIVYFPPDYATSCILDQTLRTPGTLALDEAGNLYVPESLPPGRVQRFAPPFPRTAAECGSVPLNKSPFITYADAVASLGVARGPNGHWYVANVVGLGTAGAGIREHDAAGVFIRELFPPGTAGNPSAVAVDSAGTVYFSDIGLDAQFHTVPGKGTVRAITFDATGTPREPDLIARDLNFPDAVTVLPSRADEWLTLGGGLRRTNYNPREHQITPETASRLIPKWRYLTGGMISAQPAVVWLDLPGEGRTQVVIVPSWDRTVYALRAQDGSRVWRYEMKPHPGASYPYAASPAIAWLDGRPRVYIPGGETLYCLDATTGAELWQFDAGTGCTTCSERVERNEIESTPAVVNGLVLFGMDVDDSAPGKGGFFAVRADDGRLAWYFDLEAQATCRPFPDDVVRRFDGFNSAAALGLAEDFFATRPGCDFDRTGNTCGSVWSSAAVDARRSLLFTVSANCDVDEDPNTPAPPPPMPPYDAAIFALTLDGDPAWVWRPRDIDPSDLDFGAVPNLFEAEIGGETREVVGVGGKDGTYYVLDREGVNRITGQLEPYWQTNLVPGGPVGGHIGSASVGGGSIVCTTAHGFSVFRPQKPAVHALNPNDGSILWQDSEVDPGFAPTMGVPGLAFSGGTPSPNMSIFNRGTGELLKKLFVAPVPSGVASGSTIVDGMLFVGAGVGARNAGDDAEREASRDTPLSAFCVEGTQGCATNACNDGNVCTYDFPRNGACTSEPGADGLDCQVDSVAGTCQDGVCVVP